MSASFTRLAGLFSCFCLVACRHVPTEHERHGAEIHYDLGVQEQLGGDITSAVRDFQQAIELDDKFAEAHNAYALLLHLSFHKNAEAIEHYKRALQIRPTFSEAKVNLANVYLSSDQYDSAIRLYREALNDMLYPTPYIAENNLGWALYKKGDVATAVDNIKAAVTTNPRFCSGYRNLGIIWEEHGKRAEACQQFAQLFKHCPDDPEANFRQGVCLAGDGKTNGAREAFSTCLTKDPPASLKEQCRTQLDKLGRMAPQTGNP